MGEQDLESWVGDDDRWISDEEGEEPRNGGEVGEEELGNGNMQGIESDGLGDGQGVELRPDWMATGLTPRARYSWQTTHFNFEVPFGSY